MRHFFNHHQQQRSSWLQRAKGFFSCSLLSPTLLSMANQPQAINVACLSGPSWVSLWLVSHRKKKLTLKLFNLPPSVD